MKEARGAFFDKRKGFRFPVFALLLILAGCGKAPIERVEWPVMGTIAAVQTRGATAEETTQVVRAVKAEFARVEKLLNAHDPNSELSRLAPLPEAEILKRCDKDVRECYEMAFDLMRKSGGAFNPRWRGTNTLDLGAIAKGFAVDCAALAVGSVDGADKLLDLGGNLFAVRGKWKTGIAGTETVIPLSEGYACATSAEYYRGKHIYDGRTGQAVSNGVASVTVEVGGSAMEADGLSTTLFVLGPEEGRRFLDEKWKTVGVQAVWFMKDGRCISHLSCAGMMPRATTHP